MRAIDADALKRLLLEMKYTKGNPSLILTKAGEEIYNSAIEMAIHMVMNAPAVNTAPVVHARWICGKYYNDVYGYEKTCTNCGKEYVVGFDYLFCPYCGALMDGEENESD